MASQSDSPEPSAFRPVEIAWRVHVEPVWGARRVGEVRHSDVHNWLATFTAGRSATTVLRAYGVLAAILDVAVRDLRILSNPARGVKLPRKSKRSGPISQRRKWSCLRRSLVGLRRSSTCLPTPASVGVK